MSRLKRLVPKQLVSFIGLGGGHDLVEAGKLYNGLTDLL